MKDGVEAKDILEQENFDLLITDFRMPRMDGANLLEWCRAQKIHFPVIFITANADLLPKEKLALNDCCADLLSKPISIETLIKSISDAKIRNHNLNCF